MGAGSWKFRYPLDLSSLSNVLTIDDSETWYVTTSSVNKYGIKINRGSVWDNNHNKPTIYLMGINFQVGGSAIVLDTYTDVTLVILGENKITSNGTDAAIKVPTDPSPGATLTISDKSTGILDINMTGGENVAIGNVFAGSMYDCGSIDINGGTIKTNGDIGRFNQHSFHFKDNAVVIADEIIGFDYNNNLGKGGLLFLNDDTPYVGVFHTPDEDPEFILNSPLPEPYKIEIREDGVPVTLGENIILKEDQIVMKDGTLNAFKYSYDLTSDIPQNPTISPNTLPTMYYGPNTSLPTVDITETGEGREYAHLGWVGNNKNIISSTESSVQGLVEDNLKIAILRTAYQVDVVKGQTLNESFQLVFPKDANLSVTDDNVLYQYGMKLDESKKSIIAGDAGATAEVKRYVVELPVESSSNKVQLTINITKEKVSLNDATLNLVKDEYEYTSKPVSINVKNIELIDGSSASFGGFDLKYKKKETDVDYLSSAPTAIGEYYVYAVGKDIPNATYSGTSKPAKFKITPKNISVKSVSDISYIIGEEDPDFSKAISFNGLIDGDNVSIKADGSVNGDNWKSQPGTYTVNYTISLEGANASNYTWDESTTGTLIVKKKVDPTDPTDPSIKPGGEDWKATAEGFTKIYDGQSESLNTLVATVANDKETKDVTFKKDVDYTIDPADAFKDVKDGGYDVTVTFKDECKYYSGSLKMKFIIKPRPLKVTVNEFTEEDLNKTSIGTKDVTFEKEGDNRGLVSGEGLNASANVKFEKIGDKYKVTFTNLSVENGDNGEASNYKATWYYGDTEIKIGTDGSGSIDIEDPTEGDGDGGGIIDYNDLHIIKSTGAKLTSRYNNMRTKDGGSFTLSLEKEEGYEDCEPTVYIKRGRFGDWNELKLDEVSGYYQIRSVYTDIYVKVSGDGIWPVSNEEVEAQEVKVYTQNGAIVVVTPSVMDVQVVSMTGSVVAADKVAGQREFRNLVEGVYIVRVGDKIVKVRL